MAQQDRSQTADYHDFTDRMTPRADRKRLLVGDIWINAVRCLACGEVVRSRNMHDFRWCGCGLVAVDGGAHYARRAVNPGGDYEELLERFDDAPDE